MNNNEVLEKDLCDLKKNNFILYEIKHPNTGVFCERNIHYFLDSNIASVIPKLDENELNLFYQSKYWEDHYHISHNHKINYDQINARGLSQYQYLNSNIPNFSFSNSLEFGAGEAHVSRAIKNESSKIDIVEPSETMKNLHREHDLI